MQAAINTIRVGLIDDHKLFRENLSGELADRYDIDVVFEDGDARRVFDLVRDHRPDVLLLDIAMPKVDGLRAARELLNARESENLRIILLTLHRDPDIIREALEIGVHGYITKEQSPDVIVGAIRSAARAPNVVIATGIESGAARLISLNVRQELTPRETEIAQLLAQGQTAREVAEALSMNMATVQRHRTNIQYKLNFERHRREFSLPSFLQHYLHSKPNASD